MEEVKKEETKEYQRKVVCWSCEALIIANKDWDRVKCPLCFNLNVIPAYQVLKSNIDTKINEKAYIQFTLVICPYCNHQMKTRKESEYIICSKCKNTVVIIKRNKKIPGDVDPYTYLKFKLNPIFNPYEQKPYNPYYLEKGFEQDLVTKAKNNSTINNSNPIETNNFAKTDINQKQFIKKYEVYKPLTETIREITDNIKKMSFTSSPQPRKLGEIAEKNLFNNDYKYISMNRSINFEHN